jgi:lysyl-tRNA synthetase class 2
MTAAHKPDQAAAAEEAPPVDENQIMAERRAKLARLRAEGVAYPNDFVPRHRAARLLADYASRSREA